MSRPPLPRDEELLTPRTKLIVDARAALLERYTTRVVASPVNALMGKGGRGKWVKGKG